MKVAAGSGARSIESRQNARVKELRAGLRRGGVTGSGLLAIEGEQLLGEAVRSGLRVHSIFVSRGSQGLQDAGLAESAELLLLPEEIFRSACATEHPQGVAALIEPPRFSLDAAFQPRAPFPSPLLVVAAGLQDPGNMGTLVRSAEAFGASGMFLLPGTVSLWNAKALRAAAGSAFRLPVLSLTPQEVLDSLRTREVRLLAATPRGGASPTDLDLPVALLLGNEGAGLSPWWLEQADEKITIPSPGAAESLNAAVAGAVLLYEAARQRREAAIAANHKPPAKARR